MDVVVRVNDAVNGFVWGVPAMVCIIGVGLWLSFKTGFIQIRRFGYAMKKILGSVFSKEKAADGAVTPFQAVCTALAGTGGTGNIAGVAGAIALGGRGQYSGCGAAHYSECVQSFQRLHLQSISVKKMSTETG